MCLRSDCDTKLKFSYTLLVPISPLHKEPDIKGHVHFGENVNKEGRFITIQKKHIKGIFS